MKKLFGNPLEDALVPLRVTEVAIGKPLPWPVYGPNKKLLLREGYVIETQKQLDVLIKDGVYRNPSWNPAGLRHKRVGPAEHKAPVKPAATSFCFEEMKPKVGDAVQIQIKDERYPVRLMGFVKGCTIMVTTPSVDGSVILLHEGQPVVVRSFSGKDAYAFSSSILRVCNAPLPYLHLAYPRAVQSVAVRKTPRAEFNLIGTVFNTGNPEFGVSRPVRINDFSVAGASFTASESVGGKGDPVSLSFRVRVNETDYYPTVACMVRSVIDESVPGAETEQLRYGVQFTEVQSADVTLLMQNMVYRKLLENA